MRLKYPIILVTIGVCLWASVFAQDSALKVSFPDVEGWVKSPPRPLEGMSGAYSIGFNLKDAHVAVTLYIYNRGQLNIGDNLDGDDILAEWRKVKDAVFEAGRLGFYDSVREEFSGKEHLGKRKDGRKARYCRFALGVDKKVHQSEMYLFVYRDHFIKIRTTSQVDVPKEAQAALDRLYVSFEKVLAK